MTDVAEVTTTGWRPAEVAPQLGISVSTLRRWSDRFAPFLSAAAAGGSGGHRRYSDADVAALTVLQGFLQEGLTYDQAAARFGDLPEAGAVAPVEEGAEVEPEPETVAGTVLTDAESEALTELQVDLPQAPDVGRVVADVLNTLSDSQRIIITGQATERQLLGVVLQDNFNLKEENVRLRERMLESERNLFELRRNVDESRSEEKERMRQMESQLFEMQRRLDTMAEKQAAIRMPAAQVMPAAPPPLHFSAIPAADVPIFSSDQPQTEAPPKRRGFMAWLFGE